MMCSFPNPSSCLGQPPCSVNTKGCNLPHGEPARVTITAHLLLLHHSTHTTAGERCMDTSSVSATVWLNLVLVLQNPPYLSLYWDHESPHPCLDSQACLGSMNMMKKWIFPVQVTIFVQIRIAVAIFIIVCACMHTHTYTWLYMRIYAV